MVHGRFSSALLLALPLMFNGCRDKSPYASQASEYTGSVVTALSPRPLRPPRADSSAPCPGAFVPEPFQPNAEFPPPKKGEPDLFAAARVGDHATLSRVIQSTHNVDEPFDIGLDPGARPRLATALMVALGSGDGANLETVRLLLDAGANARASLNCGTPFTFAARGLGWGYKPGGDAARLRLIIERGATPPSDPDTTTGVLCEVAAVGDAERLRVLLDLGMSANPHWDPVAAQREHDEMLQSMRRDSQKIQDEMRNALKPLLENAAVDPATPSDDPLSSLDRAVRGPQSWDIPLFRAASCGSTECVHLLLERGANPNQPDDDGRTALFYACTPQIVRVLLDGGADPRHLDGKGLDAVVGVFETRGADGAPVRPMGCAIEAAKLIAASIPSYDAVAFQSWPSSKLAYAASHRLDGAVETLLALGAPVTPPSGKPPALHRVCWLGDSGDPAENQATVRIVELLVHAGAPIDLIDENGLAPLHHAVSGDWGNPDVTSTLLELGANPNSRDRNGNTPLMLSAQRGELRCLEALIEHGADPGLKNDAGEDALSMAAEHLETARDLASDPATARAVDEVLRASAFQESTEARFGRQALEAAKSVATIKAALKRSEPN